MATTKGRKTTAKKKPAKKAEEAVVESPVEEVIEQEAPAVAQEELPPEPAENDVVEEAPVVEAVPEPEVANVEEKRQEKVKVEVPPSDPKPALKVDPSPDTQKQIAIGSLVVMPSGKQGKVVRFDDKGQAYVSKLSRPRKIYAYPLEKLALV